MKHRNKTSRPLQGGVTIGVVWAAAAVFGACDGGDDDGPGAGAGTGGTGATAGSGGAVGGTAGKGSGGASKGGSAGTGATAGKAGSSGGTGGLGASGEAGSGGGAPRALRLVVHDVITIEAGPCMPETIIPLSTDAVTYTPSGAGTRFFVRDDPDTVADAGTCMVDEDFGLTCGAGETFTLEIPAGASPLMSLDVNGNLNMVFDGGTPPLGTHRVSETRYVVYVPPGATTVTFTSSTTQQFSDIDFAPTVGQDLGTLAEYRRYTVPVRGQKRGAADRVIDPTFRFRMPPGPLSVFYSCAGGVLSDASCTGTWGPDTWSLLPREPEAGDLVYAVPNVGTGVPGKALTLGSWDGDDDLMSGCHALEFHFSLDADGEPVSDLDVDQIVVSVDGEPLTIEAGATLQVDPPTRVGLLLDSSYSITAADAEAAVRRAAQDFVDTLSPATLFTAAQFASEEAVPLPLFRADPQAGIAWRGDPNVAAIALLEGTVIYGTPEDAQARLDLYEAHPLVTSESATRLFDAVATSAYSLFTEQPSGETHPPTVSTLATASTLDAFVRSPKALLVLSDGTDTASTTVTTAAAVRAQLDACHVRPYIVAMGDDVKTDVLSTMAGSEVFVAETPEDLAQTFDDVANRIRSTYVLRVVLPQPVSLDSRASLTIDYGGQQATDEYASPGACQAVMP